MSEQIADPERRDVHLDNVKGALIVLVVLGHLVWPVPSPSLLNQTTYNFIYFFHMPAFILISGYLSRGVLTRWELKKNFALLLLPYFIFQGIHLVLARHYGLRFEPLNGQFGLWYLLSLFCWRTILPVFRRIPGCLVVAIAAALAAGYTDWLSLPLSGSRTVCLFPYFLAGFLLRNHDVALSQILPKRLAVVFMILIVALAWLLAQFEGAHVLLFGAFPYAFDGSLLPAIARFLRLTIGFLGCVAVFAIIPGGRSWLTEIGKKSLTIYLLHSPLLIIYRCDSAEFFRVVNTYSVPAMVPVAVAVSLVLGSETIGRLARPLISPGQFFREMVDQHVSDLVIPSRSPNVSSVPFKDRQ